LQKGFVSILKLVEVVEKQKLAGSAQPKQALGFYILSFLLFFFFYPSMAGFKRA
jgi:ABC-type arginine transport system permease subunit